MIQGFRDFLFRGNVIDLAVAVVIGAAFNEVVNALVAGLVNPLIAAAVPGNNLNNALLVGPFRFGLIISAIINFVLKAAVVYFVIVRPFAGVAARLAAPVPVAVVATKDQELLTEIRDELRRSRA